MRRAAAALMLFALIAAGCSGSSSSTRKLVVGAVYPLSSGQGEFGREEYRGVRLAADMVNADGGVEGRRIAFRTIDVPSADAAPGAIATLHREGIGVVLGSYGSTISMPAAYAAAQRDMLFWETGAVGVMSPVGRGRLVFRVPPSGLELGATAMDFVVNRIAPMRHRSPGSLRFAVAYANDVYGSEVARGAMQRIRSKHLQLVASVPYDPNHFSAADVVSRIARSGPNVVFVSAYLEDGVAIRRQIVEQALPLVANIGTSSSYCMPAFGARLGPDAVGVFASDKPAAEYINPQGLRPGARSLLHEAADTYEERYDGEMSAAALAGFSAAWALFREVMPRAASLDPGGIAAVARDIRLPAGSLPNGSGLEFGAAGTREAGWNIRAASVIWEWVGVGHEAVVWPPSLATADVRLLPAA